MHGLKEMFVLSVVFSLTDVVACSISATKKWSMMRRLIFPVSGDSSRGSGFPPCIRPCPIFRKQTDCLSANGKAAMVNFFNLDYLQNGNERQRLAFQELTNTNLNIMEILQPYEPLLAGTIPIAIDVDKSDLDIICQVQDFDEFEQLVVRHFGQQPQFSVHRGMQPQQPTTRNDAYILAKFQATHFEIEIFGQNRPVSQQNAYRHMIVEDRLLRQHGEEFRRRIVALKEAGVKTEPAFAQVLGLAGDPYKALLELY